MPPNTKSKTLKQHRDELELAAVCYDEAMSNRDRALEAFDRARTRFLTAIRTLEWAKSQKKQR